jgi:hypothetical protein
MESVLLAPPLHMCDKHWGGGGAGLVSGNKMICNDCNIAESMGPCLVQT